MARRSEIGDLGLAESTPTNTEIAINYKKILPIGFVGKFCKSFRGKILTFIRFEILSFTRFEILPLSNDHQIRFYALDYLLARAAPAIE